MAESKRTLLDKWRLVRAAARDNKRLSSGDVAVLIALCDRYGSKHRPDAPPKAGHALLGAMSGMSRRATIDSTRRLIAAGYISVLKLGSGTTGTTYNLDFARGEADFTTKQAVPSGEVDFTTEVNCTSPLNGASGEAYFTESPPTEAPLQGALTEGEIDCGLATPDAAGLAPASPAAPQEGLQQPTFEALWRTYDLAKGKKEARAAWNALPPDTDLAAVIKAAAAWQASWAAQNKPDAPRFTLARWLKDERYDEDAPKGFQPKERRAKGATKNTATASEPTTRTMKITKAKETGNPFGGDFYVDVDFEDDTAIISRKYHILQKDGVGPDNETWQSLVRAVGDVKFGRLVGVNRDGENLTFSTIEQPDFAEPPLPSPPSAPMTEAEKEEVRAKIAALPPLAPRAKPFHITDEERDAWTLDEEDDEDNDGWPDYLDADQDDEAA